MKLNEAVSRRLTELLAEKNMTQYQLFLKSGVPKSTIGNVVNCAYDSVKLRVVHELCHIRHHDHSPAFYRLVESVLPDYKERERLLRR